MNQTDRLSKNRSGEYAFAEMEEIRDIVASAKMGIWRIEFEEGQEPRMYIDETMRELLGTTGQVSSPEKTYSDWFGNVLPEALPSVYASVDRMKAGFYDENTYLWNHPSKGVRYVRCGGTANPIPGGIALRGYHYDVDDVVREDLARVEMLRKALDEKNEYYSTLGALGGIFYSIHVIHLLEDTVMEFSAEDAVRRIVNHKNGAREMMKQIMCASMSENYIESALAFTNLGTLPERMKGRKIISQQFLGVNIGWILASFITLEADADGRATKVIFTTRSIDEEKKHEEKLIRNSQTDELTGLLNRRAYEEGIYAHNNTPTDVNFVYMSLDVNGLKVVNDSLGHNAGDELLSGASQCMRHSLGPYSRLFRVGGDEFVAILFVDNKKLQEVLADFDETVLNWSGNFVDHLTISYGTACNKEHPGKSVRELAVIADQKMYEAKAEHYKKSGVDRRGQKEAHKVLCELYTKILRINLSDDSYQIINMNPEEQTREKGFSDKISSWLRDFGMSGQVHPDDLEEYLKRTSLDYLKEYFSGNKTSLHIFYRRKCGDEFKQVMMEIIPTSDFRDGNKCLFLYVKDIDK